MATAHIKLIKTLPLDLIGYSCLDYMVTYICIKSGKKVSQCMYDKGVCTKCRPALS